ncbi:MAG: hypothetical protein LC797_10080 [Chloroflexi bacterium]|nr:hypothetical protein [Chloroflexota bacterium]
MAVPALAGRGVTHPSGSSAAAIPAEQQHARRFGHGHVWTILALAIVALSSRVYTTNSLAGEPTSDEYLYAVHARDLARDWASGQAVSLEDLGVEGRSVAVEAAALSFVLPWDPLTNGRTMQAFFNALCIPCPPWSRLRGGPPCSQAYSAWSAWACCCSPRKAQQ